MTDGRERRAIGRADATDPAVAVDTTMGRVAAVESLLAAGGLGRCINHGVPRLVSIRRGDLLPQRGDGGRGWRAWARGIPPSVATGGHYKNLFNL